MNRTSKLRDQTPSHHEKLVPLCPFPTSESNAKHLILSPMARKKRMAAAAASQQKKGPTRLKRRALSLASDSERSSL
jgi:hypothetical protein